jgi:DNA-binding transcriptional MerR regulator/methylmalonyl-CoA mutase cobalamin-binding subunit
MYTIKQAAARSGVPVELLRAWERRYGVVEPARTDSGYRLYDEPAIARLRAMRGLIDAGWAPSTAAAHIRPLDDASVDQILGQSENSSTTQVVSVATSDAAVLAAAFVASAATLDEAGFEEILDEMFARGSFEQVTTDLVMPALVALGEGWQQGRLDISAEHAAAGAVQRRLGLAFMAAGTPRNAPDPVLVGMPPGTRHDLGALAFATAARRAGIAVRYLGADLPVADWLNAVGRTGARAIVIGAVIGRDVKSAGEVARAVRNAHSNVHIFIGGRHAQDISAVGLEPATHLPQELSAAVEVVRRTLERPA